jgi:hypothetical protein
MLPSSSKTVLISTKGGVKGADRLIAVVELVDAATLVVATVVLFALVKGARVVAHVPMNSRARTTTPNINFAKLGFLVMGAFSYLFVDLPETIWFEPIGKCGFAMPTPLHQARVRALEDRG